MIGVRKNQKIKKSKNQKIKKSKNKKPQKNQEKQNVFYLYHFLVYKLNKK